MATTTQAGQAAQDRRRAREDRGVRSTVATKAAAERLPAPPRERRPALAALAVLLIVGGAAIAGLIAIRADSRVPVMVARTDIPIGTQITAEHLTTTPVASESELLIPAEQEEQLIGMYATVPISEGRLIDSRMVGETGALRPGSVIVGAALAAGRVPASGLIRGDVVDLVRVVDGVGQVIVSDAQISSAVVGDGSGAVSVAATVSIVVDRGDAAMVAAVAAANELAIVLVSEGVPLGEQGG